MDMLAESGDALLDSIAQFCRRNGMAESTFGRRAVNDGKFVARLRDGARITPETLERVSAFMGRYGAAAPTDPPELRILIRFFSSPRAEGLDPNQRNRQLETSSFSFVSRIIRSMRSVMR